jgi:membrane associated rhomboid family serine protease
MIGAIIFGIIKKIMISYVLIISNIVIFIFTLIYYNQIVSGLGFRPIYLSTEFFPQIYTLFTSMFIHGGFAHIFGNMLVFFFVGIPFEQRIGLRKFLIVYLITGVCAALAHSLLNLGSPIPLIGASGAIFGIMGAFAFSYPRDEIIMPIGIGIMFLTRIKVMYAVLFFAIIETIVVAIDIQDTTAHFAHLGGLISGFILAAVLIKPKKKVKDGASFQTIYNYPNTPQNNVKKDYPSLRNLADTTELKEMLKKIENETLPQIRDVWLEHYLEKTICPKCKKQLNHFDGKIWCENCGFKTEY